MYAGGVIDSGSLLRNRSCLVDLGRFVFESRPIHSNGQKSSVKKWMPTQKTRISISIQRIFCCQILPLLQVFRILFGQSLKGMPKKMNNIK